MARKRCVFGASFKAEVTLAATHGDQTTAQLAAKFAVRASPVTAWKKQLLVEVAGLFEDLRRWIEPTHPILSLSRQCELLGLAAFDLVLPALRGDCGESDKESKRKYWELLTFNFHQPPRRPFGLK